MIKTFSRLRVEENHLKLIKIINQETFVSEYAVYIFHILGALGGK